MTLTRARTCSVCGGWGAGPDWSRYSSVAADEACKHEVVVCSPACEDKAGPLIAAYDRAHATGACVIHRPIHRWRTTLGP